MSILMNIKNYKITASSFIGLFFVINPISLIAQDFANMYNRPGGKKIIPLQCASHWDWSADVKNNLENMQAMRPYMDGVIFHTGSTYGQPNFAFNNEIWTEESLRFDELKIIKIKSTKFTDNFILMWGHAQNTDPDFFNDTLWKQICKNAVLTGKAVNVSGSKGIMFDPEFYSPKNTYSPWWYSKTGDFSTSYLKNGKSFSDVQLKARQRGKEYVQALQTHQPQITILTTFLYSYVWAYCYDVIDKLPASQYALLGAFADGMIEGLNKNSIIIDGNETSYYSNESRKYVESSDQMDYKFCKYDAPQILCDSAILKKWKKQGQVAMAPYFDYCYNIYLPNSWSFPAYQSKWMTHNIYNALLTTDQYVWLYVESMDFWKGKNTPADVDVYKDFISAIDKFRNGKSLGYDMHKPDTTFKFNGNKPAEFINVPKEVNLSILKKIRSGRKEIITTNIIANSYIAKVEYYLNSMSIGMATVAPYNLEYTLPSADMTFFARIFLKNGTHYTSAPLFIKKNLLKKKVFKKKP